LFSISWAVSHGITDRESTPKPFDATAQGATWQYTLLDTVGPRLIAIAPAPGATLSSLDEIKLSFSEAVSGVDSDDLLINGTSAKTVKGAGAGEYTFTFLQPSNGLVTISWETNHFIHDFAAAQNGFAPTNWSYMLDTNLVTDIVINEIMYHPSSHQAKEAYIELFNRGSNSVNLAGWEFTSGISFKFPNRLIGPGAYLAVAADLAAFSVKYPTVTNVIGGWEGSLSHSSEEITLKDAPRRQG
jgi:hypothetical protein